MSLKNRIAALAEEFSAGVLAAIRTASLEEILSEGSRGGRTVSAPAAAKSAPSAAPAVKRGPGRPKGRANGRLPRRSPEQLAKVIETIVVALKKQKAGLRSEQLQKALGLDKREISGPLNEALAAKKISKKGQRRATTYFAK